MEVEVERKQLSCTVGETSSIDIVIIKEPCISNVINKPLSLIQKIHFERLDCESCKYMIGCKS